jgi:hypothetical protein
LQFGQAGIPGAIGAALPYYNTAAGLYGLSASTPDVASFLNPYAQNVMAGMQDIFGNQMKQTTGNLTQQAGGVGADRIAVGQAELARQQGLAAGQTLSGIYGQAQQAAAQQRAQQAAAAQGFGNLGTAAQASLLSPYLAYAQLTGQLAPALGGQQTGQTNQAGSMKGNQSGTGHSVTTNSPSPWSDFMNIAGFAGGFFNRGGRTNPYARGGSPWYNDMRRKYFGGGAAYADGGSTRDTSPWEDMQAIVRNGQPYADGGDVDFADRWGAVDDAMTSGDFDPVGENNSPYYASAFAPESDAVPTPRERPAAADDSGPLDGEVLPPVNSPPTAPTAPWKPAPYEGEMPMPNGPVNPYAAPMPQDRSSLSGFLASRGIIGPDTAQTMSNFGRRLQRAALAGSGPQGAAAAQQLPLQERGLDLQQQSLQQRAAQQWAELERHREALLETQRHNRATEDIGAGRLEQENWQMLGPTEDGTGTTFLNRKSGETRTIPLQIAGKLKPLPAGLQKDLGTQAGSYHALSSLESGFKDSYGGSTFSKVGDIQNWIARNMNIGNTDAADWWQEYQRYKNGVRHGLFGSALTANEISEWEKSDITPGMAPDRIKQNIKRQREVVEGALQRRALSLSKQGYSKEAIEAEMGIKIGASGAPAAPAPEPGEKKAPRTVKQNGWIGALRPPCLSVVIRDDWDVGLALAVLRRLVSYQKRSGSVKGRHRPLKGASFPADWGIPEVAIRGLAVDADLICVDAVP